MWTCHNCQNQSEENYRFCWSCGNPKESGSETVRERNTAISFSKQSEDEPKRNIPQVKAIEREDKPKNEDVKDFEKPDPEITIIEPIKSEPEKKTEKTKEPPKEAEKAHVKAPELELFATFLPESEREDFSSNSASDWENVIFTIAVRLVGLYFIFLVLTTLPQFVSLVYFYLFTPNAEINSFSDLLATDLFGLTARILFYLIVGIYLIASGRILLWMLPRK